VDHHDLPVAAEVDIELDRIDREFGGVPEAAEAVLGPKVLGPAVGDDLDHDVGMSPDDWSICRCR
jgi:hypothetical protein